jgi:hypothetical protein
MGVCAAARTTAGVGCDVRSVGGSLAVYTYGFGGSDSTLERNAKLKTEDTMSSNVSRLWPNSRSPRKVKGAMDGKFGCLDM